MTILGVLFTSFILTSCNSEPIANDVYCSKTVGDWYHEVSKNMGGYGISAESKLTIVRNGDTDFDYNVSTTTVDQMYGGHPKTEYYKGKLDDEVLDGKWKFKTGDYGERGGYIVIPEDSWQNNPKKLKIEFASGRGNSMVYKRSLNPYE